MVVIDDPLTSFDHENKIGIYSFLRKKISEIIEGNEGSRFIILTHNYDVAYNLEKIIRNVYKSKARNKNIVNSKRLEEFILYDDNFTSGISQYKKLLNNIYLFGDKGTSELTSLTIGNSIRRVMEMFSSFIFNEGPDVLSKKVEEIEGANSVVSSFIDHYMLGILVNCESHSEYLVKAFDENDSIENFSENEKEEAAKIALVIILILYENHLKAYFKIDEVIEIRKWKTKLEKLGR